MDSHAASSEKRPINIILVVSASNKEHARTLAVDTIKLCCKLRNDASISRRDANSLSCMRFKLIPEDDYRLLVVSIGVSCCFEQGLDIRCRNIILDEWPFSHIDKLGPRGGRDVSGTES